MECLREYILEKLHISKSMNIKADIEDIIIDYLEEKHYFGFSKTEYTIKTNVKKYNEEGTILYLPKQFDIKTIDFVGDELCKKINNTIKADLYWQWNKDDVYLFFGNDIVLQ